MLFMPSKVKSEEVSRVMSALGSIRSEAKTAAARENAAKGAQAVRKNPLDVICICAGGESLNAADHKTTCPRGRLLWQRKRAAEKKAAQEQGAKNVS